MDARNIVIDFLKRNGFDGLCCDGCGCGLDDFAPCGNEFSECFPAKRFDCDGSCSGCSSTGENYRADNCYRRADIKELKEKK